MQYSFWGRRSIFQVSVTVEETLRLDILYVSLSGIDHMMIGRWRCQSWKASRYRYTLLCMLHTTFGTDLVGLWIHIIGLPTSG